MSVLLGLTLAVLASVVLDGIIATSGVVGSWRSAAVVVNQELLLESRPSVASGAGVGHAREGGELLVIDLGMSVVWSGEWGVWRQTSGGPDLRDCMAQPISWSSRSVNLGASGAVPRAGDLIVSGMAHGGRVKCERNG